MTKQQKYGCAKCKYRKAGKDKRFVYCSHKGSAGTCVSFLPYCPKMR